MVLKLSPKNTLIILCLLLHLSSKGQDTKFLYERSACNSKNTMFCDSTDVFYGNSITLNNIELSKRKNKMFFVTKSFCYHRCIVYTIPVGKRLRITNHKDGRPTGNRKNIRYDQNDNPQKKEDTYLWMFNKNWLDGYIVNQYFYFNSTATYKGRPFTSPYFFIEMIDDCFEVEVLSNVLFNSNQKQLSDSISFLLNDVLSAQKKILGFEYQNDTLSQNKFQLEIKEEVDTQNKTSMKLYWVEKISQKKYEWLNITNFQGWNKKQKTEIKTKIKQKLSLYLITWEKRLSTKNTNQLLRIICEDLPIQFKTPTVDWRGRSVGLPRESMLVSTNLSIFLNNIIVRQQIYGNKKFDFFLKKPNDNFKGKTLYLKTILDFDTKNKYFLTLSMKGKENKTIIFDEDRISDNDMAESTVELVNVLEKWINE